MPSLASNPWADGMTHEFRAQRRVRSPPGAPGLGQGSSEPAQPTDGKDAGGPEVTTARSHVRPSRVRVRRGRADPGMSEQGSVAVAVCR